MSAKRCASRWLVVVLFAVLVACGGGGGGGGTPDAGTPALGASKIFVGDRGNGAIGSSPNSNPSAGAAVVDRIITGGSTFLTTGPLAVRDFALDATNDRLFVSDSTRILVFDNVSTATGNVSPRILATAVAGDTFSGIYLDTVNNLLYATVRVSPNGNEVRVYLNASSATNALANRIFSFACDFMFDIAVDTTVRDLAYVYYVTAGVAHVAVLANASTLNAFPVTLTQTIDFNPAATSFPASLSPASTAAVGIFLDTANNRLYVPNVWAGPFGTVEVLDNASSASGFVGLAGSTAPSRPIVLNGVATHTNVFVDTGANRLYAADPSSVTIAPNVNNIIDTSGGVRILAPGTSQFTAVAVKP